MIASSARTTEPAFEWVDLGEYDAPEMLALAQLTKPGPFCAATHRLGRFVGVKHEGRLVAMAGSGCSRTASPRSAPSAPIPTTAGRGYAAGLMSLVAARVRERGETAFLHVYAHNTSAIALYEALGFTLRRPMTMTVLD
jgi:predicted GNAT family acetyltransferase